jgi:aspartyl/glutamyl-tRNA(Asn/Gln) amidotransferase C subunit
MQPFTRLSTRPFLRTRTGLLKLTWPRRRRTTTVQNDAGAAPHCRLGRAFRSTLRRVETVRQIAHRAFSSSSSRFDPFDDVAFAASHGTWSLRSMVADDDDDAATRNVIRNDDDDDDGDRLTTDDVRRIAALSHLNVADAELPELHRTVASACRWIGQVRRFDTRGVEPLYSLVADAPPRLRADVVDMRGATTHRVLSNAANTSQSYLVVPQVVDLGDTH